MKLSIITCTYNREKCLQQCIDSVIAQNLDLNTYEHIFVDAYSKDKTKTIIKNYMAKYKNVRLIEREPKGVYNAMNEGIKEAKGEYILCLNSDDFLVDNILSDYLGFVEKTGNKDLYCGILNNVKNGDIEQGFNRFVSIKKFLFVNFGSNVLIYHPTCLVKKKTLFEMGLFDEDKKIASDYGMWLKMIHNKKEFVYFPKSVSNFRVRNQSLTVSNEEIVRRETNYYQKKYIKPINRYINKLVDILLYFYNKVLEFLGKIK